MPILSSLTSEEAEALLKKHGPNLIEDKGQVTSLARLKMVLKEPMLMLLVAVAFIYLAIGNAAEGILISCSALLVITIAYIQQTKSDKAIDSLRELSSPRALVFRDGNQVRVSAKDIVPRDWVYIGEGDRVPADGIVVEATNLTIDESLLTGESQPVPKTSLVDGSELARRGNDKLERSNQVFASTLVTSGYGIFHVENTGKHTQVGVIGTSLSNLGSSEFFLSKEVNKTVRLFGIVGMTICISLVFLIGIRQSNWILGLLSGLAAAMALLPEEFPVILSIFTAIGASRLAKHGILTRNAQAIERLGAIKDLCVDKTGTLTCNKMSVAAVVSESDIVFEPGAKGSQIPEKLKQLVFSAFMASRVTPNDPMEKAIHHLAALHSNISDFYSNHSLTKEYPLSSSLLATSTAWDARGLEKMQMIGSKGAPEAIMGLCKLDSNYRKSIDRQVEDLAKEGLRVIGVAEARRVGPVLPTKQEELDFRWLGLIAFEDPMRPQVAEAMNVCRGAGINVIMMTGDYPVTAEAIAKKAGFSNSHVVTGEQIKKLSKEDLKKILRDTSVFARLAPAQKLRLVRCLQDDGHVVGMTGDGINDAPALRAADVGIAMGLRGTDVAREAADLVLTDDSFISIVDGIKRGRAIFDNIRAAMIYVAAIHVPIAGLAILPAIFDMPLMLLPAHIVLLELLIDPACSILFETRNASEKLMIEKPRDPKEKIFSKFDLMYSLAQGSIILIASIFLIFLLKENISIGKLRSIIYLQLVLSNIGLVVANFTGGSPKEVLKVLKEPKYAGILIGAFLLLSVFFVWPSFRALFQLEFINPHQLCLATIVAFITSTAQGVWNWRSRTCRRELSRLRKR